MRHRRWLQFAGSGHGMAQPCFRGSLLAGYGRGRDAQYLGGLLNLQPTEIAQFDDLRLARLTNESLVSA